MIRYLCNPCIKTAIFIWIGFLSFAVRGLSAQTIRVTGAPWNVSIGDPGLPAGQNPFSDVVSAVNQILLDVHGQQDRGWSVTVYKTESLWHSDLILSVHRTGQGSGGGTINGGLDYVSITNTPKTFFTGGKNMTNIPCQYILQANMPPDNNYSTTITYTITGG